MAGPTRPLLPRLFSLLLVVVSGLLIGLWVGREIGATPGPTGGLKAGFWAILLFPAALLLAVILHEVGHVLFARVGGCRPRLFVIGPLSVKREDGRLQMEWNWSGKVAGGLVVASPPDDGPIVRPVAILIAGGPLINLLCALLAGSLYLATEPTPAPSLRLFAGLFAGASLFIALTALNPFHKGLASDGRRLLRFWRGGPPAERDAALFTLTGLIYAGLRPAQWPGRLLEQATTLADGTPDEAAGQILAFYQALDLENRETAAAHLARAMQLIDLQPPAIRPAYYLEAAYGSAMLDGDAERAAAYLARGKGGLAIEPYGRLRCEAAVLLAQGQTVQAMERVDRALEMLSHKEKIGTDHLEESLLLDLQARAGSALEGR
ncbi:MAG: site-2 protease family protein [Bacillota bacterium]